MSTPRPKRHVNRRNASHEPIADYVDPPGVVLKPSNLSTGTILPTFRQRSTQRLLRIHHPQHAIQVHRHQQGFGGMSNASLVLLILEPQLPSVILPPPQESLRTRTAFNALKKSLKSCENTFPRKSPMQRTTLQMKTLVTTVDSLPVRGHTTIRTASKILTMEISGEANRLRKDYCVAVKLWWRRVQPLRTTKTKLNVCLLIKPMSTESLPTNINV